MCGAIAETDLRLIAIDSLELLMHFCVFVLAGDFLLVL